jgi:hypothetical protein
MSEQTDFNEKMWKLLNLQADTLLKVTQNRTQVWKVAVGAATAGAALFAAGAAFLKLLQG